MSRDKRDTKKLRFGLPKGSLQEATIEKMAKAGFNIQVSSRSYIPYVDDEERATVENLFAGARACPTDAIIIEQYGRRVYPRILAPNRESNVAGE